MNIKTKFLMCSQYIDILKNDLGYEDIKVLSIKVSNEYKYHPRCLEEYIYNRVITIKYHLLVDNEEIDMTIIKEGIHLNGKSDYQDITICRKKLGVLYPVNVKKKILTRYF